MSMPVNLFVVLHGESLGNLVNRQGSQGNPVFLETLKQTHTAHWPLSNKGREQAGLTGVFLNDLFNSENIIFDQAYVSAYARALETAARLEIARCAWRVDSRIVERNWGDLDGLSEEERQGRYKNVMQMRHTEPYFWNIPNGEPFDRFVVRIRDFVDSLYRADVQNVLVVCHGEVMKALRVILTGMTPEEYSLMEFSDDPLVRIHNTQVDHYTRNNPNKREKVQTLSWLRVYRPSEEVYDHASLVAVDWTAIKRRTYDSHELLHMSGKMSKDLRDYV